MNNRLLDLRVARRAQRDEIAQVIGHVDDQIVPSSVDVVDVQAPSARATFRSAETAYLVSFNDTLPDFLPHAAMRQDAPTAPVRMIRADHAPLRTRVRAVSPPSLHFAGKCAKRPAAGLARQFLRRGDQRPAALPRAGLLPCVSHVVRTAADNAMSRVAVRALPFRMALARTESALRRSLDRVVWSLEVLPALIASVGFGAHLRCVVARVAAVDRGTTVRLELFTALGAHLEHR